MKRDRTDDALRRKLGDVQVTPPEGVWRRISASLGAAGASTAATAGKAEDDDAFRRQMDEALRRRGETAPAAGGIKIRKPRKLRWGTSVAAAVLLCAIVIGYRIGGVGEMFVAAVDTPARDSMIQIDRDMLEVIALAADLERARAGEGVSVPAARRAVVAVADIPVVVGEPVERDTETAEPEADDTGRDENTQPDITSDRRRAGVPARGFAHFIAEDNLRTRRAAPLEFALYTANLAPDVQVGGTRGRSSSSTLAVYEVSSTRARSGHMRPEAVELRHRIPLSFGASVAMRLHGRVSVESGLVYTYLSSESRVASEWNYRVEQQLHYVGIPVGLKYDILQNSRFGLYGSANALFEVCVSGVRSVETIQNGRPVGYRSHEHMNVKGIQPSAGLHIGVEVRLRPTMGLYIEPGMRYYFESVRQPESYRTENPLGLSLRAGIRFSPGR